MKKFYCLILSCIILLWSICSAKTNLEKEADELYNLVIEIIHTPKYQKKYPLEVWISVFKSGMTTWKTKDMRERNKIVYDKLLIYSKSGSNNDNIYQLVNIVDWDTITVRKWTWDEISVRLIWIDAPENTSKRYWYAECYWFESKEYLTKLLSNVNEIELEMDTSQWEKDVYGRLLAYAFYNGENINQKMIAEWYGWEYTYNKPYKYVNEFKKAEEQAKNNQLWLRSNNSCKWERIAIDSTPLANEKISSNWDLCSKHTWYIWSRWWCYYNSSNNTKVYDSSKICCK